MKVVILAGGYGTRLQEYTGLVPKPMVQIGGKPILWHIMQRYAKYGFTDFYVALGYKSELVKDYFINYSIRNSDLTVKLDTGEIELHQTYSVPWKVTLVETGLETMTGGRLRRLKDYIGDETFMLTYGDGVSDIDLNKLVKFHKDHGKLMTMTTVRPPARFGEITMEEGLVVEFEEKPSMAQGWVNGGFFVIEPGFLDLIDGDEEMLERQPIEKATRMMQVMGFKHAGFWQCMDNKRDKELLEELWLNNPPWIQ